MNEEMRLFLLELADLMERHHVTGEAVDDGVDYYPSVDGVEFDLSGDFESGREYCNAKIPRYFNPEDIRKVAEA
jgi:hypothetical protein